MYALLKSIAKLIVGRGVGKTYAQDGEDAVLASLVKDIQKGVYVDVGAYHPIHYSNTYALYRRGWRGVVIDANAQMRPLYRFFRPRDTFVHTGVGSVTGVGTYYVFSDGAYNTFSEKDAEQCKKASYPTFLRTEKVQIQTLTEIVHAQKLTRIDVLSIDIEGLDVEVLSSHDWSIAPRIILIEDNSFNPEEFTASGAYQFLHAKGYKLTANTGRTLFFGR